MDDKQMLATFIVQKSIIVEHSSLTVSSPDPEIGDPLYQDVDKKQLPPKDTPINDTPQPSAADDRRPPPSAPTNATTTAESATYQDPSTIKREHAPTGDLYALPEKKLVNRQPSDDYKVSSSSSCNYLFWEGWRKREKEREQRLQRERARERECVFLIL